MLSKNIWMKKYEIIEILSPNFSQLANHHACQLKATNCRQYLYPTDLLDSLYKVKSSQLDDPFL